MQEKYITIQYNPYRYEQPHDMPAWKLFGLTKALRRRLIVKVIGFVLGMIIAGAFLIGPMWVTVYALHLMGC